MPKCIKSDSKGGLGRSRWPLGCRLVLGVLRVSPWSCPAISFSHVGYQVVDFWHKLGACWILKRIAKVFFQENRHKIRKVRSKKGVRKSILCWWIFDANREVNKKFRFGTCYSLRGLRGSLKLIQNRRPNSIKKSLIQLSHFLSVCNVLKFCAFR